MKTAHHVAAVLAALLSAAGPLRSQQPATPRPAADTLPPAVRDFRHAIHTNVPCSGCHSSQQRHGQVMIRSEQDCERCHHLGPGRQECTQCHNVARLQRGPAVARTFQITARHATITLRMRFDHEPHAGISCERCHGDEMSRAPTGADCAGCHAQHHRPTADCTVCHQGANALAEHTAADHASCATPTCHGQRAENLPSSREACLVCHAAQRQHVPGRLCVNCHPVRGNT